jgi:hypothetical protein
LAFILCACAQSPQPPEQAPVIVFQRMGATIGQGRGNPIYSLSIFTDGTVVFAGIERTKEVSGRTKVPPQTVVEWVNRMEAAGALELKEHPSWGPIPDGDNYRLVFTHKGRSNSYRWYGWNANSPLIQTIESILTTLRVDERWAVQLLDDGPASSQTPQAIFGPAATAIARRFSAMHTYV